MYIYRMGKKLLLTLFICLPLSLLSQEIERVKITGKIKAALAEDVEGVSIYNVSSQKGIITDEQGNFEIEVAENDRLSITALQFSTFTIVVDKSVIEDKKIGIYLNPVVNQLEEVIVRQYDLSGDIVVDVSKIKTANVVPDMDLSFETLEFDYEFTIDKFSSIKGNNAHDAFHNGQEQYGGDLIGLVGDIILKAFLPKRKNKKTVSAQFNDAVFSALMPIEKSRGTIITSEREAITAGLRDRFTNKYISETFGIAEDNVNDFLLYVEEHGMQKELLFEGNEIELLEFLFQKSEAYKKQGE